ncbi:MAG: tRNA-intron lyase [Nanoarchaeota archaeon]|nr:tRNA-intron lyase [Nanoarchaeota archaeon]MBU1622942.1 tRNA-intron lyase [Nanoarchaeota archaeon]MBU1973955.1 tRNA-intron lyase [Nanoarchaeota archaeon]
MVKKTKKKVSGKAAKSETSGSKASDVPEAKPQRTSSEKKTKQKKAPALENKSKKKVVTGILAGVRVITESSDEAREFYNQSRFGTITESGKVELSLLEALYLMEKNRLVIKSEAGRAISFESYVKKARKEEPNFWIRYIVFKDMRNRGYIIKTALKFGADFRVYDRGIKPGEGHARWIVYPVDEGSTLTWHEFSAKNRVAHSTKKRLLMGIIDAENDVTYYEIRWMRP